jgi:hypothetical protein
MPRKTVLILAVAIPLSCLLLAAAYYVPPVNDRLAWRVDELRARLKYALNPPEEALFIPSGGTPLARALELLRSG